MQIAIRAEEAWSLTKQSLDKFESWKLEEYQGSLDSKIEKIFEKIFAAANEGKSIIEETFDSYYPPKAIISYFENLGYKVSAFHQREGYDASLYVEWKSK